MRNILVLLIICSFASPVLHAGDVSEVFHSLINEMLVNHPRLQSQEGRIRQQYYGIRESRGALLYPEIDIYASRSTTRTFYEDQVRDDTKQTVEDTGVRLNYNLFRGFGDWHRLELSHKQYETAKESWVYSAQGFLLNLAERYSNYLQAYHNLQVARETFNENKSILEYYSEQRRLRLISKSDYYLARARFYEAEAEYIRAQQILDTAYNNLLRLLNTTVERKALLPELVPPGRREYSLDLNHRPEYLLELYALEAVFNERKMAESNFYPRLDFSTSYGRTDDWFTGERRAWRVQLQLSMNLFRGFQDISRLQRIDEERYSMEKNKTDIRRELQNNFENTLAGMKSAQQDFLSSKENYNAMQMAYEAASEELKLQLLSYPEFMTIQTSWVRARENYNNALINFIFSDIELQILSGYWYDYLYQFITVRMP